MVLGKVFTPTILVSATLSREVPERVTDIKVLVI